jgi:hypothetical protein
MNKSSNKLPNKISSSALERVQNFTKCLRFVSLAKWGDNLCGDPENLAINKRALIHDYT